MKKRNNNNNNNYEDFASFATRRISTLAMISGHLKGIVRLNIISYMYILTYLYILAESSAYHLLHGQPVFFRAIPT